MKLLLDIGNTRLKWAWWDRTLIPGGAVRHLGMSPATVLEAVELKCTPTEVWVASVATPAMRMAVEDWVRQQCHAIPHWVVSRALACGVRCAYAEPEKLGVDRWLAIIAGYHRARRAACVVDAGTALTLDVVDADGRHLGGLIAPGLGTQRQSLQRDTQVRADWPAASVAWLGTDTDTAVTWGTLHASIGLVERVLAGIRAEHPDIVPILTGGEAGQLLPHLGRDWILAPDLVLEGLGRLALENSRGMSA